MSTLSQCVLSHSPDRQQIQYNLAHSCYRNGYALFSNRFPLRIAEMTNPMTDHGKQMIRF